MIADVLRAFVLRAPPNIVEGFGTRRDPRSLQRARHRQHPAPAFAGTATLAARPVHALGRRDAGRRLRERPGEGAVRLRRHRRQLCQPLCGGFGLRDAASCVRRGERQEGRLGPCHRRHGRDHAGHGARRARPWRRDRAGGRRPRGDRRARPRGRRHPRQWRDRSAPDTSPPASIRNCCTRGFCRPMRCRREFLARIKNWRNGSGTFRINVALSALPSFTALPGRGRSSHRRHHHRAQPRLYGPRLAGRARPWLEPRAGGRGADPLDAGRDARARRASMSRACSASTSRRNYPTDDHGTTTARKSPIS